MIVLGMLAATTNHAAAAPMTNPTTPPVVPTGLKPIGPIQEWKSRTVENNRPGPLANTFTLPAATSFISVTVFWRGTNNDGLDNEHGIVRTSAPSPFNVFSCGDFGHGTVLCATFGITYTSHRFDVSAEYDLSKAINSQHGDSHKYTVLVQPYGKPTSDTGCCTSDRPGGNTPGGNTPGGNTPGGNNPGGNTPDMGCCANTLVPPGWTPPTGNESGDAPTFDSLTTPTFGMYVAYAQAGYGMIIAFFVVLGILILGVFVAHLARYFEHASAWVARYIGR
jgi:hypothetical protein